MKIRFQLALAICGMSALSFVTAGYLGYRYANELQRNMIHQLGRHYTKVLEVAAHQGFASGDLEIPIVILHALRLDPQVEDAYVIGPGGWMVSQPKVGRRPLKARDYSTPVGSPYLFAETLRREKKGLPFGSVRVEMARNAYSSLFNEANSTLFPPLILLILAALVLTLAVALSIAFWIGGPIQQMLQGIRELGSGNLQASVDVRSGSELGELAGEFNEMARKLRSLDELKDEWISKVSHDVRSPMGAVKMYADYMLHEDPERDKILPKHKEMLAIIEDNALRLNVFVSNLLDAAKMKAGRMEFHPQPLSIEAVFKNVLTLYQMVARQRKIELVLDAEAGLPAVQADPEPFDRVIFNLVSNALKFTGAGGKITLGARRQKGSVEVFIADTGKGIPPEMQAHLFERFYQADVAGQKSQRIQGTGLGLYIVKQTVEGMGGRIGVESELGQGTRFSIVLPADEGGPHA